MKSIQQVIRQYFSKLSFFILLLVVVLTNAGILFIFNSYLNDIKKSENEALKALVTDAFEDGQIDMTEARLLRQRANQNGILLKILSSSGDGKLIFDSSISGNGNPKTLLSKRKTVLDVENLNYTFIDIGEKNGQNIKLKIGREKGWLITDEDISFVIGINMIFFMVLIIAVVIVWRFSRYLAEKISAPIIDIQKATDIIKRGDYQSIGMLKSDTRELNDLGEAISSLAYQLNNQEQLRKRMTTDIAHELRSPLAVIRSQIEAMMDNVLEPSQERFARLNGEIMRVTKLIDDMNELSVIENDLYELKRDKIDLNELISYAVEDFKLIFEEKGLNIGAELQKNIYMTGDKERMRQVINNLLSNAYKYTDNGGVAIRLEATDAQIIITVADTGIGISERDLPFIFERFYRSDISRSRKTGGAGIGLAIAKKIIEAHEASISVKSELDKGTAFTIKIPKHC